MNRFFDGLFGWGCIGDGDGGVRTGRTITAFDLGVVCWFSFCLRFFFPRFCGSIYSPLFSPFFSLRFSLSFLRFFFLSFFYISLSLYLYLSISPLVWCYFEERFYIHTFFSSFITPSPSDQFLPPSPDF